MSESFLATISFEIPSKNQMKLLETVFEHLDLFEPDEAREILCQNNLKEAKNQIDTLTAPYSKYTNDDDLVEMYIETYENCIDDFSLKINRSYLSATIVMEGADDESNDFCSAQVLLLISMGATNIHADGHSPNWNGKWTMNDEGACMLIFEEPLL